MPLSVRDPRPDLARFDFIKQSGTDTKNGLRQVYAAMTNYVNRVVGNMTSELKRLGAWENTIFFKISDNAGPIQGRQGANYAPLRGGKLTFFEGGVRVNAVVGGGALPAIARGKTLNVLTHVCDGERVLPACLRRPPAAPEGK